MTNIIEMYGKCDGKDILFKNVGRDEWECTVPADFNDGTYIVEIWAKSQTEELIFYTAVLYMSDGKVVSLQAQKDDVVVIITDNRHFAKCIDHIVVKAKVSYEL